MVVVYGAQSSPRLAPACYSSQVWDWRGSWLWIDNFFVNGRAKHWRKRSCRARRQLISSITSSSTQCQSNTRLYSVERENISTWNEFNRKVNTWNGNFINLRSVSVTVYIHFKCTIGPKYRFINGPSKTEMTISRTQNRSWTKVLNICIVNLEKRTSLLLCTAKR